jgi:hypothetical protein
MPWRSALALALAVGVMAGCGARGDSTRLDPAAPRFGPAPRYRPAPLTPATAAARPLGGLRCDRAPGRRFGAHLEVFVHGLDVVIPAGIGIAPPHRRDGAYVRGGACSYPLRTSEPTGVIEVRAGRPLTLGRFFDLWGQPLGPHRLLSFDVPAAGALRAFVNGRRWPGDPRSIPLRRHVTVLVELGRPVTKRPVYLFPDGL